LEFLIKWIDNEKRIETKVIKEKSNLGDTGNISIRKEIHYFSGDDSIPPEERKRVCWRQQAHYQAAALQLSEIHKDDSEEYQWIKKVKTLLFIQKELQNIWI
jgi:hypothetical protein